MLAVLAAVTEVIKEQGGKETTTEYYAALVTHFTLVFFYFRSVRFVSVELTCRYGRQHTKLNLDTSYFVEVIF